MASVVGAVFLRALRRPGWPLAVAILVAGAFVVTRARKTPTYEATLYFRLAEGDLGDLGAGARPPVDIRRYLTSVALSRHRVEEIMAKYRLSGKYRAADPVGAIDDFRDDIQIEVSRNYFLYDRHAGDPPRSALVTISLWGTDAERTRAILREIGDAVLEEQVAQRGGRLAQAREVLGTEVALARARTKELQGSMARLRMAAATAGPREALEIQARLETLAAEVAGSINQELEIERRAADVAFSTAAEGKQLGLSLDLFDERLVVTSRPLTPIELAGWGAIVFALAFVLAAAVYGTFDDRVAGIEDLEAFRVPVFGALPRFPGDDAGGYRARWQGRDV